MTREWFDVGAPKTPKRRPRGDRDRVSVDAEKEALAEVPDKRRNGKRLTKVKIETEASEVKSDNGRGDHEGGTADISPASCPVCNGELICRKCDTSVEARAQEIL